MIRNASRQRKNTNVRLKHSQKDLVAFKQSILDDGKIVKKGVRGISVKIYPENE